MGLTYNIVLMSRRSTYPQCMLRCSRPDAGMRKSHSEIPEHICEANIHHIKQRRQAVLGTRVSHFKTTQRVF